MTPPPTAFSETPFPHPGSAGSPGSTGSSGSGGSSAGSLSGIPGGEAHTLASLLSRQRDHYQQLKELSDAQQALIADGEAERLLSVLAERQGHVEALTTLNEQLAPLRSRMSEIAEEAGGDVRQRLRGLVDEVQDLLEGIIHQDERDKQALSAGKDQIKKQIDVAVRTPAALSAYKVAGPTKTARFTDRQG